MPDDKTFPHVIRVAFGNCFVSREMGREMAAAVRLDRSGVWEGFGGSGNVSYYVMGKDNASILSKEGAKNVRLVDPRPLVHDPAVSFWYNKTLLYLAAFKDFGMDAEVLYLDCDVEFCRRPDAGLSAALRGMWKGRRILSPIRSCKKPKRMPLVTRDKHELRICPCNCLMYCRDGKVIEELLPLYGEIAAKYDSSKKTHWTGTPTTWWDDESVSMYWFDKLNGRKTTAEIVEAFEPGSTIRLQRHPPPEATAVKRDKDIYMVHH